MPTAAKRLCAGGCRALVDRGYCPACQRRVNARYGTTTERGYDGAWRKLRTQFLAERCRCSATRPMAHCPDCGGTGLANALCRECISEGYLVPATQVDHVLRFQFDRDRLRLEKRNLQGICEYHHARKSNAEEFSQELSPFQQLQQTRVREILGL